MNLEKDNLEKNKRFLEYLERRVPESVVFKFYDIEKIKLGFKRKLLKLIYTPNISIPLFLSFQIPWFLFKSLERKSNFFNSRKIILPLNNPISVSISIFGFIPFIDDIKLTKFLIKNLKENDIFYDIGANYGFYTYLALEFCKEVHSFEPIPNVFKYLHRNLENEPRAILNNVALLDSIGNVWIYVDKINTGESTVIKEIAQKKPKDHLEKITISTTTLDNYLKNHNNPTIIKIDVEGAESKVIEGGINFFMHNSPIIIMEVWNDDGKDISMKAIKKLLDLGFKPYNIKYNGDIELIENPNSIYELRYGLNIVFKK
jgi:FkbM family methyltransferase